MQEWTIASIDEETRQKLVSEHEFITTFGKEKLLKHLNLESIRTEAENAGQEALANFGANYDTNSDPDYFWEMADEIRTVRYQAMWDFERNTRLSIIACFYFNWEKSLREWIASEILCWCKTKDVEAKIWRCEIRRIIDLLRDFNWNIRDYSFFKDLEACRLIVNVHKHGNGISFNKLKRDYPGFVKEEQDFKDETSFWVESNSFRSLTITDADLDRFSGAITEFWNTMPSAFSSLGIGEPADWFLRATGTEIVKQVEA